MTMRADEEQWSNLRQFWNSREGKEKVQLTMEKSDILLKGIVKRFFNEKEVTSTLVMDALYCGCRALDVGDMPPAEAAKLSSKPNRAVWLSVAQNKVRETFFFVSSRLVFNKNETTTRDVLRENSRVGQIPNT